jgi:hypothetical protein
MNIFEFENERFGDVWNKQSIEDARKAEPPKRTSTEIVYFEDDEKYREFQEANFLEYFDPAKTYRYALWK